MIVFVYYGDSQGVAMDIKVHDSELKVMEALWNGGEQTAGQLAKTLNEQTGWNRNTTYTVIKKLIAKGAVARRGPGFTCRAAITKDQVRRSEAAALLGKLFDGSAGLFLSAFISGGELSKEDIEHLKSLVEKLK